MGRCTEVKEYEGEMSRERDASRDATTSPPVGGGDAKGGACLKP